MKKIAELEPEKFFDLLGVVLPIVPEMLNIPEVDALLDIYTSGRGEQTTEELSKMIFKAYTMLAATVVSKHRAAVYTILSIMNDKSVAHIKTKFSPPQITTQLISFFKDEEFQSFLSFAEEPDTEE